MADVDGAALRDLIDRQAITDLIYRYCRAVDRIDPALGHTIFHADATADYGDFYQGSGRGAIDAICESHRHMIVHSHQVTTITIALAGDRAGSEAYHIAGIRMMAEGKPMQVTVWGRYLDRWSRRDGGWGIDHRRVIRDFDQIAAVESLGDDPAVRQDRSCPSYAVLRPSD